MVRKSLLVIVLLAVASPLAAQQEEWVWSTKRPDTQPPFGVTEGRMLEVGQVQLTYRFSQLDSKGVWYQSDSLTTTETLGFYAVAPLTLANMMHEVGVEYGATEDFTISARINYSQRRREQVTAGGLFYVTDANNLGDLEVTGLYSAYRQGGYRAHIQLGALIPTGTSDVRAETPFSMPNEEALPYDMRPGAGTFGVEPGVTMEVQNEVGSVGGQVRATFRIGKNSLGYGLGNQYDANAWAAYKVNEFFSVSVRAHYLKWNGIEGADPSLDPARDPGNEAYYMSGNRVDVPVGLNLLMPEGTRFAGHRIALEAVFPVHKQYDGPQLGADWGFNVGWQAIF